MQDAKDTVRYALKGNVPGGLVNAALKFGRLVRPNRCMMCTQDKRSEAHHDDYSKPLVVRWLCKQCHESWHINNTPKY